MAITHPKSSARRHALLVAGLLWLCGLASPLQAQAEESAAEIAQAAAYCQQQAYAQGKRQYRRVLRRFELAPARRFELIQALAWCEGQTQAIDALFDLLEQYPGMLEARLFLAKLLAWNGRMLQAQAAAQQVLAQDAGNREARLIQANAASWRGDFSTALPIYEGLLTEEEEFEARLGYSYALLASGNYEQAKYSRWWLYAAEASRAHTVFELNQALINRARRSITAATEYLTDKGDIQRVDRILSLNLPFERSGLTLELRRQSASDPWTQGERLLEGLTLGGHWRRNSAWTLSAALGRVRNDVSETHAELGSLLQYRRWLWDVTLLRELYDDTAAILDNHILRHEFYNHLQYTVNDWVRLNNELRATRYSDDNQSYEAVLRARYALKLLKPRVELGYMYHQQGFERQSGGGYFAPDKTHSHRLTLGFITSSNGFEGSGEIFYGHQRTAIGGIEGEEEIAGLTLDLRYTVASTLALDLSLEGGDFALSKPEGYYYWLAQLGVSLFF